jgi:Glycosyltransferase family 87
MRIRFWFVLSLCVCGISWLYVHRTLEPWTSYIHAGERTTQMGDLYSPWVGTRDLLIYRRNPYGPEVSHEIQMVFYGHVINQTYGAPGVPLVNEQRFVYPIYVVFLMAPTIFVDFAEVQRWAPFVLGLLTATSVLLCLQILHWRLPWLGVAALALFTLSSPQIVQGLRLEQLAVVVGFLLTAGAWCVTRNRLAMAGAFLAFSTIKPQMALIPLCWFAVWAVGDWPKRWRLPAGFVGTVATLIVAGELLRPGWIGYFLAGLAAYRKYFPTTSLLRLALGDTLGEILGGLIVLVLLAGAWRNREHAGDSPQFASILAMFFTGAILAFPLLTPFNQVMLILPAMLILHDWNALPRFSRLIFAVVVSWPWVFSLVLLLFPPRLDSPSQIPLLPSLLVLFVPLILPLLLMTRPGKTSETRLSATDSPLVNL